MTCLAAQPLSPCKPSDTALSGKDIRQYLKQINGWKTNIENNNIHIVKTFNFKNYASAQKFTNDIAELAEQENHHPKICIEWGKVTVLWWTHTLNGLFINDFIMAARCDDIYSK